MPEALVPVAGWDIERLIASFGGIDPLIAAHREFEFAPLNYVTVSTWRTRGSVPSDRLAELFVVLIKQSKGRYDLADFIKVDGRHKGGRRGRQLSRMPKRRAGSRKRAAH